MPTIFMNCHVNLQVWISTREIALDLGKRFTKRVELYISVFILVYLSIFAFKLFSVFGVIQSNIDFKEGLILEWDCIIVFILVLRIMKAGIKVNENYESDKGVLLKLKRSIIKIKEGPEFYKDRKFFACEELEIIL